MTPETESATASPSACPRCGDVLRATDVQPHGMLACVACGGIFLSHGAVREVLSTGHPRVEEMAARVANVVQAAPRRVDALACPFCATTMTPVAIHGGAVDAFTCNAHGSWFNAADVARLRPPPLAPPLMAPVVPGPLPAMRESLPPDSPPRGAFLKPNSLIIIAWLWIVLGGGWFLMAIPTLLEAFMVSDQVAPGRAPAEAREMVSNFVGVFVVVLVAAMAVAGGGAICGVAMLRLREWGRRGLVVCTWLLLIYIVGFFGVFTWTSLPALAQGSVIFLLAGVVGLAMFGWPAWIMLRHLRGDVIRNATEHASYFSRRAETV